MISKQFFYLILAVIAVGLLLYFFNKTGLVRLFSTSVKVEVFCDELAKMPPEDRQKIIDRECSASCRQIQMQFRKYECESEKQLVCVCK